MEAKDVALLGFVSAAQKYVDKHMNDGTNLGDLKNINIRKLKDELSAKLNLLALSEEYRKGLIDVGEKAFDEYAKENLKPTKNVFAELGEIFDVNFDDDSNDEELAETKEIDNVTNEIGDFFGAYDFDENEIEEPEEELNNNYDDIEPNFGRISELYDSAKNIDENIFEEKLTNDDLDDFGISDDDNILLTIANAAAKSDEELAKTFTEEEKESKEQQSAILKPENMDEVYADIVNNENSEPIIISTPVEPETSKHIPLSEVLKEIKEENEQTGYYDDYSQEVNDVSSKATPTLDVFANPGLDIVLKQEEEALKKKAKAKEELKQESSQDDYYNVDSEENRIITNPGISDDKTLSDALYGLGRLQERRENIVEKEPVYVDPFDEIYDGILVAYPYLTRDFVKSAYSQKEEIANTYVIGEEYILLHRLYFQNVDDLQQFVEIMIQHNYYINADENKMIVDAFNKFVNEDGLILSNILSVANQAKVLNGEYDGYRVISKNEQ